MESDAIRTVFLQNGKNRIVTKIASNGACSVSGLRWDMTRTTAKLEELRTVVRDVGNRPVLVLCHNNPDPDTIASAFAFSHLLTTKLGVKCIMGYGGMVTRAENKAMIQRLQINLRSLSAIEHSEYYGVALIDAQPATGNNLWVTKNEAPLIVIDHHPLRKLSLKADFHDVRKGYGATSTIMTEYFIASGIIPPKRVANALLYGIKSDTNSLLRGVSKVDFNAFNFLSPLTNPRVVGGIERPSLSVAYFRDYFKGLCGSAIYRDVAVCDAGRIHSESIIPEIADMLLRLDKVSWSLCLGRMKELLIISVRSTSKKFEAGNVIRRIVGKMGSAGGHREMAGGQVSVGAMSDREVHELTVKLVRKFLKSIGRDGITPRPLVVEDFQENDEYEA